MLLYFQQKSILNVEISTTVINLSLLKIRKCDVIFIEKEGVIYDYRRDNKGVND